MPPTAEFGVPYAPSDFSSLQAAVAVSELAALGISWIRIIWVDFANIARCRVVSRSHFLQIMQSPRQAIALAEVVLGMVGLRLAEGLSGTGEYLYVVDSSTLRLCPYEDGVATVMGFFQHKIPPVVNGASVFEVDLCPRTILRRVIQSAKKVAAVEFLVGFEIEFILLKSTRPVAGGHQHLYSGTEGLMTGTIEARVLREICDSLVAGGVDVTMYHPEAAPGQYEIDTGPLPPLQAADALIYTRETIRNVATKHGLHATFAPRIDSHNPGNGAHTHISVHSTRKDEIKLPEKLASFEEAFLAGLLSKAKALVAVTLPLPVSYQRMVDGVWSGGTYISWGTDNRETPVRLTNISSPKSRNFEVRFVDPTSNPHLVLAMIIGAGYDGIANKAPLNMKDASGPSAAQMSAEERADMGITERFPLTWEDARDAFVADPLTRLVFGTDVVINQYLSVNKMMAESLEVEGGDEEAKNSRLVEQF